MTAEWGERGGTGGGLTPVLRTLASPRRPHPLPTHAFRPSPLPPSPSPPPCQVFGRVLGDGMLTIRKVEAVATGPANRPKLPCVITECGEM
jgi:hypothetical protein